MTRNATARRRQVVNATLAAFLALAAAAAPAPSFAQGGGDNATVKLIQLLIEKGILTPDQAKSLLSQAQSESRVAKRAKPQAAPSAGAAALATAEPPAPEVPKGTVRVTYVPQSVRDQIAAQVRTQVLDETQKNGWAAPNAFPDWTKRVTIYGDLRVRGERDIFDKGNTFVDPSGVQRMLGNSAQFLDFPTINGGAPFDTLGANAPATLNTKENRTRYRLRARIGLKADIDDWISADFRVATGNDNSPVSTNQTLGQNTNFGKYSIWLDRAYATLQVPPRAKTNPFSSLKAYVGRMADPFWVTDLLYDDDLNFDGIAASAVAPVADNVNVWATGGAFVAYNTTANYGIGPSFVDNQTGYASRDKYLFAGQVGVDFKPLPVLATKFAAGVFGYTHVQGQLSSLCTINVAGDVCDTDNSRPQFAQFGNTYFPIRNINPTAGLNGTGSGFVTDPQYYGLASRFDILDLHARADFTRYDPFNIQVEGEYVKNLAFNKSLIASKGPVNNVGDTTNPVFSGGDTGWLAKILVGKSEITKLNEWNVFFGYKYLESDAVVDGFTDSDFHLGGTNAQGYFVGAGYGIGRNTYINARVLSANEITGPRYRNDVVQIDLNTKF